MGLAIAPGNGVRGRRRAAAGQNPGPLGDPAACRPLVALSVLTQARPGGAAALPRVRRRLALPGSTRSARPLDRRRGPRQGATGPVVRLGAGDAALASVRRRRRGGGGSVDPVGRRARTRQLVGLRDAPDADQPAGHHPAQLLARRHRLSARREPGRRVGDPARLDGSGPRDRRRGLVPGRSRDELRRNRRREPAHLAGPLGPLRDAAPHPHGPAAAAWPLVGRARFRWPPGSPRRSTRFCSRSALSARC